MSNNNELATEKILITGAGFTHNFGAPLAKEMWAEIFNHEKVQGEPKIRELMLNDFDYESIYYSIIEGDYEHREKDAINIAVSDAYKNIDEIVRNFSFLSDAPYPVNLHMVQKFINLFCRNNKRAFFFTLNQDIFIERRYFNHRVPPVIPGIKNEQIWFSSIFKLPLKENDYCQLPKQEEVEREKVQGLSMRALFYIKLHGSQNWKSATGTQDLVIGRGKEQQIQKEPLLAWYSEIFKTVLFKQNRHLLVIGYGFGDDHINEIIANAIKKYGLKIYVISPESVESFREILDSQPFGNEIWEALSGYYPYTLLQMFPTDGSQSQAFINLRKQFFGF